MGIEKGSGEEHAHNVDELNARVLLEVGPALFVVRGIERVDD